MSEEDMKTLYMEMESDEDDEDRWNEEIKSEVASLKTKNMWHSGQAKGRQGN